MHDDRETALARGRSLRDAFGPERLRVELTRPLLRGDRARLRTLHELAARSSWPTVVTNDVHVHHRRRAALQDALVAIRCGLPLEACEAERRGNREHVLKGAGGDGGAARRRRPRPSPRRPAWRNAASST